MSRNPLIEAIHEARYDLQTCAEEMKPAARQKLYDLLEQAACGAHPPVRPDDVLDALYDDYNAHHGKPLRSRTARRMERSISVRSSKFSVQCSKFAFLGRPWSCGLSLAI
jgi:hypothetical protein